MLSETLGPLHRRTVSGGGISPLARVAPAFSQIPRNGDTETRRLLPTMVYRTSIVAGGILCQPQTMGGWAGRRAQT